jgi:hypothetical protein
MLSIPAVHRRTGPYGVIAWLQLSLANPVLDHNKALAHTL